MPRPSPDRSQRSPWKSGRELLGNREAVVEGGRRRAGIVRRRRRDERKGCSGIWVLVRATHFYMSPIDIFVLVASRPCLASMDLCLFFSSLFLCILKSLSITNWYASVDTYEVSFWTYDLTSAMLHSPNDTARTVTLKVLLCGGLAGCATWSSIFPLDVIKTRVQTQTTLGRGGFLVGRVVDQARRVGCRGRRLQPRSPRGLSTAQIIYQTEGLQGFFRGFAICNFRAFVVNAVQWAVYEGAMRMLATWSQ